MPVTCIVVNCGSRSNRDNVSFYSVPTVLKHRFLVDKNDLSRKRRHLWLAALKRDDLTDSIIKNQRVCSKHFITGKPAALEDEGHPDWVPSQNMGHKSQAFMKQHRDVERKERLDKRRKLDVSEVENSTCCVDSTRVGEDCGEEASGISTQTDITMEELALKFEQLSFASKRIEKLTRTLENTPFGLLNDTSNDGKWKYYTGFDYKVVNFVLYMIVKEYIPSTSTTALSSFNQLLLTLIKLRLDLHFRDLSYRFNIAPSTSSTYFQNIIDVLYKRLKPLIIWPDRSVCQKNIPLCFKEAFHDKTTIIIDCFEVFIEKPASLLTQQQCWSNYKHHHTIKFLIGITPQGTISYISDAWGGRTSDKQIVECSDFLKNIKPGDIVLADRGFLIKETLAVLQSRLIIPAFTKGKNQLHPLEIEETRQLAHVRIHVERIIGMVKNKFNLFKGVIPISMLKKGNNGEISMLDKIVIVCCALVNITPSIIPL